MRKEDFFEVLGELDDDIVKEAEAPMKKRLNWKVWGGAIAACFTIAAVLGAGVFQNELFGKKTDIAILENGDKIVFVKSELANSSLDIDGTITTRPLSEEEIADLFPDLSVTAHAVFRTSDVDADSSPELIGLEGNIGNTKMVVSTSDVQLLDTVIVGREENTKINGISMVAGYFVTDPNSRGEQNAIYYATLEIGSCKIYLENAGRKGDSETIKNQLAEVIQKLTENGELDLTSVIDRG